MSTRGSKYFFSNIDLLSLRVAVVRNVTEEEENAKSLLLCVNFSSSSSPIRLAPLAVLLLFLLSLQFVREGKGQKMGEETEFDFAEERWTEEESEK